MWIPLHPFKKKNKKTEGEEELKNKRKSPISRLWLTGRNENWMWCFMFHSTRTRTLKSHARDYAPEPFPHPPNRSLYPWLLSLAEVINENIALKPPILAPIALFSPVFFFFSPDFADSKSLNNLPYRSRPNNEGKIGTQLTIRHWLNLWLFESFHS